MKYLHVKSECLLSIHFKLGNCSHKYWLECGSSFSKHVDVKKIQIYSHTAYSSCAEGNISS